MLQSRLSRNNSNKCRGLAARHQRSELHHAARAIESAIDAALKDRAARTADFGGKLGTRAYARHLARLIGQEFAVPRSGNPPNILRFNELLT